MLPESLLRGGLEAVAVAMRRVLLAEQACQHEEQHATDPVFPVSIVRLYLKLCNDRLQHLASSLFQNIKMTYI